MDSIKIIVICISLVVTIGSTIIASYIAIKEYKQYKKYKKLKSYNIIFVSTYTFDIICSHLHPRRGSYTGHICTCFININNNIKSNWIHYFTGGHH